MTVTRWDPFREMLTLQDRMNRLFQEGLSRQPREENIESAQWAPPVDIVETSEGIVLRADLPGVDQNEIELKVDDNILLMRGARRLPSGSNPEDYHRAERPHGSFVRSFSLPGNIDQAGIRAAHRNGVLEVTLPKKKEAQAKSIRVEVK